MQYSAQTGSSRREERIPFDTVVELRGVELRGAHSDERLEAEGFNVSMGGIALRAAFVPPLGAQLECRFHCPPEGELVCAQSEVTWVSGEDGYESTFGLRFVELDTKSATALRRYLAPTRPLEVTTDRLRAATLQIDGLEASVEAELKLADETRIVLEQQLTFLQLGRGVEVQVLGRGKERGRIASVELRHSDFDVPTLVFGILLDDAPERSVMPDDSGAAPLFADPSQAREATCEDFQTAAYAIPEEPPIRDARTSEPLLATTAVAPAQRNVRMRLPANDGATLGDEADDEPAIGGLSVRIKGLAERLRSLLRALVAGWRERVAPKLREQADALELPEARTSLLLRVARGRAVALRMLKRERRSTAPRATRPPPLRMQRSTLPGVGPHEAVDARPPTKRARAAAVALTLLAIGLGAYALAPHSGADRARPTEAEQAAAAQAAAAAHEAELAAQAAVAEAAPVPVEPPPLAETEPFGDAEVPNGRVFVLRMNGPVQGIEGTARELGFKVRIPRRLSLDRASPIAQSHPAVARAMILNRGAYAELSVDFLPGEPPRYRVVGKGSTLEVTIERPQEVSDSQ